MTFSLLLLLILACPLIMMFMMRGGHGHGGHAAHAGHNEPPTDSLDELKRRRAALDAEIDSRESR